MLSGRTAGYRDCDGTRKQSDRGVPGSGAKLTGLQPGSDANSPGPGTHSERSPALPLSILCAVRLDLLAVHHEQLTAFSSFLAS
jgi:hypothetical protein